MGRLVNAELLKIRTTKTVWGLLLLTIPLVAINTFFNFARYAFTPADVARSQHLPSLSDPAAIRSVLSGGLSAKQLAIIIGILLITTEFRHMTVTPTFLSAPRRSLVVVAKLIVGVLVGVAYAVVAIAATIVTGVICYAFKGLTFDLGVAKVPQALLGTLFVIAVYTVIGIGVGTLIKNQIAAILIVLGWDLVGETLVSALLGIWKSHGSEIYRWFPGNAASAITDQFLGNGITVLRAWQGIIVLIVYGLVFAGVGAALTLRRDIT